MIEVEKIRDIGTEYSLYLVESDHVFDLTEFSEKLGLERIDPLNVRAYTFVINTNYYLTIVLLHRGGKNE